jgi:hypothetical protein
MAHKNLTGLFKGSLQCFSGIFRNHALNLAKPSQEKPVFEFSEFEAVKKEEGAY